MHDWDSIQLGHFGRLLNKAQSYLNRVARVIDPPVSFMEEETATHSSILAWEISWAEEPGRLQSMGLQRGRHDLATKHSQLTSPLVEGILEINPLAPGLSSVQVQQPSEARGALPTTPIGDVSACSGKPSGRLNGNGTCQEEKVVGGVWHQPSQLPGPCTFHLDHEVTPSDVVNSQPLLIAIHNHTSHSL